MARTQRRIPHLEAARAVLAAWAVVAGLWPAPASAQAIDTKPWITNGSVQAMVRDGSTLYIGGSFSLVGPATGGVVPIDASSGATIPGFPQVTGTVYAVAPDGEGGFFIGGDFTAVGGLPRKNLAHIGYDMHVFAWDPSPDNPVRALALHDGLLYAGGLFTTIGGRSHQALAQVDTSTGLATSWYPGTINIVYAIAAFGNTLYIGGNFCCVGGNFRSDVAAIDIPTAGVKSWNPNANGNVFVLSVDPGGSTVYAGGQFSSIGGQARNRLAALSATTGSAQSWNPNPNATVWAILPNGSFVYVGGDFTTIGGQSRNRIAAIDAVDGSATSWNPNANLTVNDIVRVGAKVYAAGDFTSIGGQTRNRIAELDATTGSANPWNPNLNGTVEALAADGFVVYAGGSFTMIGGVTRNNIAAIDLGSGAATAWNPNANNTVLALALAGSTVYAGGVFTNVGGQARSQIAALSASTGLALSWNPGANGGVNALATGGTTVYAAGGFTIIGGQFRNRIAALDAGTGAATGWNPNANASVRALALDADRVYAAGHFTSVGGQPRNYVAALDAVTGNALSWNPAPNAAALCIAIRGGTVYVGGDFTLLGGLGRNRIGAVDVGGAVTPWNPDANGSAYSLAVSAGTVYVGGGFTTVGGQGRYGLAALDATTGAPRTWNPNPNNNVGALLLDGPTLYAGGPFTAIKALPRVSLAAIAASPHLQSIVPSSGGNAGPVTVTMYGDGLGLGGSVSLTRESETSIPGVGVITPIDGSYKTATFDLDGAATGLWSVLATMSDGQTASLTNAFTIEGIEAPQLRVSIVGATMVAGNPSVRRDRRTAFDLVVDNPGNVDAVAVPLWLAGVPSDATLELDFVPSVPTQSMGEPDWNTMPRFFTGPAGKYVSVVIPRVPPGATAVRFYLTVPGPTHPPFTLIAAVAPPWMDGEVFRSCLATSGAITNPSCMGAQLDALNLQLAANPAAQPLNGIAFWAKNAWQCEGGVNLVLALTKAEQVLDFLEGPVESGTASADCLNVSRPRWRDVVAITVVGSIDPNEKLGMQGSFSGQTVLPYSIRFENFSTASLPAQDVIVTDQLNPSLLDLSTINLEQITFGNRTIFPPPGLSSFSTTVDLRPQKNLLVNVSAGLDPVSNVISWYFNSIDPATGRTPTDFSMGFLPPNVVAPEGEGSVMFTVMPQPGLATGTQISNSASILFDDPPALLTAAWTNGADNSPPASNVLPLAPQSNQASIPVSWTAPAAPPDLRDYTVFVKQDNGPYRVWRLNTPTTSDTLVPPKDHQLHTFTFYSVARDLVGNIEAPPAVADATTQSTTGVENGAVGVLSLAGARPNPARGAVHVWLTLPSREPATLEMLDVAGRRIARRDVGSLGAGSHLVTLAPSPAPRAGLYFLRLTQGDRELKARVALIR